MAEEVSNNEELSEGFTQDQTGGPEAGVVESITLRELDQIAQIIDLASQRGAFRGAEMTQVGAIFDKLNAFLSYVAAQQEANAEANAEEGDSEEAEASAESE